MPTSAHAVAQKEDTHDRPREGCRDQDRPPKIRITVVIANRYTLDAEAATGKQIRERANIPAGCALYRRMGGGNEPIGDDDSLELRDGDHLFARPPSNP